MTAALLATRPDPSALRWAPPQVERRKRQAARLMSRWTMHAPERKPYAERLANELIPERLGVERLWRNIRDYLLPSFGRFLDEDKHDWAVSHYRASKIRDSSPVKMALTAADGLHGGLTNQAEQWFTLYVGRYNNDTAFGGAARDWILNAQECVRDTLAASNFYTALYPFELELLCAGTAFMLCSADPITRARYYHYTFGSYWLAMDSQRRVDTAYIRHMMRAVDIVTEYGEENCPDRVIREMERSGGGSTRFPVIQCIQPWNYFGNVPHSDKWTYEDVHYVEGGNENEKILYRNGFQTRPFVTATWSDSGDSPYGMSCPGFDSLPDIKELYQCVKDYGMAVKWLVDPSFAYSGNEEYDHILPGKVYRVTGDPRNSGMVAIVPPSFDINVCMQLIGDLRERIKATMYNREFLLVQSRERQITATEVNQLIAEKNTVLGPISARISDNVLMPILDRTFEIIDSEWGVLSLLDEPPDEIDGLDIKPYFTGQLARAQRQGSSLQQIQSMLEIAGSMKQLDETSMAAFNLVKAMQSADELDLFLPGAIRTQDEIDELMTQQQQAMAQQQQQMQISNALQMAKTAGDTSLAPDTLAGQMAGMGDEAMPMEVAGG